MQLAALDHQSAMKLGSELRRRCESALSTREVAEALIDDVNGLEDGGRRACVLVRAFVTRKLGDLAPELQAAACSAAASASPDSPCLQLVATRGILPPWNSVQQSHQHRVLLLSPGTTPMIAELARQLGLGGAEPLHEGIFYIADAATSSAAAEKEFVAAHAVRSILGFGTTVWPGESLVVIAFTRRLVERATACCFATLARYAQLAFLQTPEARAALGELGQCQARAHALDELVRAQECQFHELTLDSSRRLEAVRAEAQRAVDAGVKQFDAHNLNLRRTQRAMLNVIEDLREARTQLAQKVAERTRELAETNTELAARNRDLEEFVYIASHDLQEPLRTVAGYIQMIERRYGSRLGEEADEFIRFAIEGAQRMQALIESLLLYSRVAKKERVFEPVELDEVLDIALRNLAVRVEETGAAIERAPLPRVQADRMQMVQLFQNLLSNALKFAGEKPPRIHVTSRCEGGACSVSVRDEGLGFNPKYAERIFQVFRRLRRDTPGTGIGLSICKKIMERHRGRIEAHAAPGAGATFTVHFAENPTLRGAS